MASEPRLFMFRPILHSGIINRTYSFHIDVGAYENLENDLMRNRISLLIAMVVALTALLGVPRVQGADALALDTISPQVVDSAPARGEELPVEGSVTFYFDQPM